MKKFLCRLFTFFMLIIMLLSLSACGDDYTAQDLQDAKGRYYSGQGSASDKRMVEGFNRWKANH